MSGEARAIARYGRVYGLANLIARAAGLVLLPVYAHALTVDEFGVYTVMLAVMDICSLVFGAGISKAMGRYYFDHPEGHDGRDRVVSTTILGFGLIVVAIGALAYPLGFAIVTAVFGTSALAGLFALAIVAVAFTVLLEIVLSYFVIRKQAKTMLVLSILRFVAVVGSNVVLVVFLAGGINGVIQALLLSFGTISVATAAWILRRVGIRFDAALFAKLLAFGLPLVPSAAANSGIRLVERHVLTAAGGLATVGIYGLGDRLASLLQMFVATPFSQIFFVRRFETMAKGEDQEAFHRILLVFVALIGFCGTGLAAYGAEIVALIAPGGYAAAVAVLPLLALGHILSSLNLNIEIGLQYAKRTWLIPAIGIASLLLAVPITYACVHAFGMLGAALAFVLVNILRLAATVVANARIGTPEVRLDWPRTAAILIVATVLGTIAASLQGGAFAPATLAAKTALLGIFVALLLFTPMLPRVTRAGALRLLRRGGSKDPAAD